MGTEDSKILITSPLLIAVPNEIMMTRFPPITTFKVGLMKYPVPYQNI